MHLISRLFAAYLSVNTQEHLAYCFCLKIPKLEPQLRHHWAMSKHHKRILNVYSVFLLFGETEAIPCFCHPSSTSPGCPHRIAAEHGGAPRDTEFPPSGLHRSHALSSRRAVSVLHCLRKESPESSSSSPWLGSGKLRIQPGMLLESNSGGWDHRGWI